MFRHTPERLEAIDGIADQNPMEVQNSPLAAARLTTARRAGDYHVMGGTPSNCTLLPCSGNQAQVIAGISLPMPARPDLPQRYADGDRNGLAGGQGGAVRWITGFVCHIDNRWQQPTTRG